MPRYLLLLLLVPLFFPSCSPNNVTVDNNLQRYFDSAGAKGCFALFDNGQGHFTVSNLPRFTDSAYTPGPTFEILQSLIGLQTGALANDEAVVKPSSLTLKQLFQSDSVNAGPLLLAHAVGLDSLKKWVDSLRYGTKDLTDFRDTAGINTHLKITADEQLGMIKKLYFDQLPFFQRTQKLVRDMMLRESNSNYRLVYMPGRGQGADGRPVDWLIGWVEENKHPYFFVCNYEGTNPDRPASTVGLQIVKNIFRSMGFLAGHK